MKEQSEGNPCNTKGVKPFTNPKEMDTKFRPRVVVTIRGPGGCLGDLEEAIKEALEKFEKDWNIEVFLDEQPWGG